MTKVLRKKDVLILGVLLISVSAFSQDNSKFSITYGGGYGYTYFNEQVTGLGPHINVGLSYQSKFDRLRMRPNLQIGRYLSGESDSKRDEYFNCMNFDLLIDFTLIEIKSFSLDFQAGGFIGKSRGLIGTGTEFDRARSSDIVFSSSQFINDFNYGFKMGGGVIYAPKSGRFSYGLYPFNLTIGNNGLRGVHAKFGINMGLYKN